MDGTHKPQQEIVASEPKQDSPTLAIIAEAVKDPAVNTEKLSSIIDVMERLERRDGERAINAALAKLNLPHVKKNGKIPLPSGKDGQIREVAFAKWEDVDTVIRPLLMAGGLSLSFTAPPRQSDGGGAAMIGRLSHVQGAFREAQISLPLDSGPGRNNLQAMGSTISYGKKYLAFMLLNIVTEGDDDDGQNAEAISIERAVEIDLLITQVGADKARFLKFMKVESVPEIRARDYKKAIDMLNAKKKEKAKA
jgi:hypothetical protein